MITFKQVLDAEMVYKHFKEIKVKACVVRRFSEFFSKIRDLSSDFRQDIKDSSLGVEMTRISEEKKALEEMYKEIVDENGIVLDAEKEAVYEERFKKLDADFVEVNKQIEERASSTFIEDDLIPYLDLDCTDLDFEIEFKIGEAIFYHLSPFFK